MNIELVSVDTLSCDPTNARQHDARSIEAIAKSLERFGQQKPIVIASDGTIAAGNGTYLAAKKLGWQEIQIVRTHLCSAELNAYKIADNRTTDMSKWDYKVLADLLRSFKDEDASLIEAAGFLAYEAEPLMASDWSPPAINDSHAAASVEKKSDGQSCSLHFNGDQWAIVEMGIERIRDSEGDKTISGSKAIELIVADWLS